MVYFVEITVGFELFSLVGLVAVVPVCIVHFSSVVSAIVSCINAVASSLTSFSLS